MAKFVIFDYENSVSRFLIDNVGNVGIATTSPVAQTGTLMKTGTTPLFHARLRPARRTAIISQSLPLGSVGNRDDGAKTPHWQFIELQVPLPKLPLNQALITLRSSPTPLTDLLYTGLAICRENLRFGPSASINGTRF